MQCAKLHPAVDTLGHILTLHVASTSSDDRAEIRCLAQAVQASRRA